MPVWLDELQQSLAWKVAEVMPANQAQLIISMIWGNQNGLDTSLRHYFKITGMQHVVSASGYNVGLVVGLVMGPFSRFWHLLRLPLEMGVVILYVHMAGASPSLLRAGVMRGTSVISRIFYRQYHPGRSLIASLILFGIWQPSLLQKLSFQLSFLSTLGIWWWSGPTSRKSNLAQLELHQNTASIQVEAPRVSLWKSIQTNVLETVKTSLAAQSLVGPLLIYQFGEWSWLSLPANVTLTWLTPLITEGGLKLSLISWLSEAGGGAVFHPVLRFLSLGLSLVTTIFINGLAWWAQFDSAFWSGLKIPWWMVGVLWLVIAWSGREWRKKQRARLWKPALNLYRVR
jgi:competence protein ComEC